MKITIETPNANVFPQGTTLELDVTYAPSTPDNWQRLEQGSPCEVEDMSGSVVGGPALTSENIQALFDDEETYNLIWDETDRKHNDTPVYW